MLPFLFGAWGISVLVRTPTGTILVANVPDGVEVLVDEEAVTLSHGRDTVTIAAVAKGEHMLKITRDGRAIWSKDVTIEFAGQEVKASYSPFAKTPANDGNKSSGRVVDLLKMVKLDGSGDVLIGQWSHEPDGLHCQGWSLLRLPYRPPAEYDFTIEFTINKVDSNGDVYQICSVGDTGFAWMMGRDGNANCGFYSVDGFYDPPSRRAPPIFESGKRYRSVVSVRRDGVTAEIDNTGPLHFNTNFQGVRYLDLCCAGLDVLGIATLNNAVFHEIKVQEVSGQGRPIRRLTDEQIADNHRAFQTLKIGGQKYLTEFAPAGGKSALGTSRRTETAATRRFSSTGNRANNIFLPLPRAALCTTSPKVRWGLRQLERAGAWASMKPRRDCGDILFMSTRPRRSFPRRSA